MAGEQMPAAVLGREHRGCKGGCPFCRAASMFLHGQPAAGRVGELELPVYLWEEGGRPGGQACGRPGNCHWAPVGDPRFRNKNSHNSRQWENRLL